MTCAEWQEIQALVCLLLQQGCVQRHCCAARVSSAAPCAPCAGEERRDTLRRETVSPHSACVCPCGAVGEFLVNVFCVGAVCDVSLEIH